MLTFLASLLLIALFLWAATNSLVSRTTPTVLKAVWIAILLVPGLGFLVWFFVGPRISV